MSVVRGLMSPQGKVVLTYKHSVSVCMLPRLDAWVVVILKIWFVV